ncbi:4314_t:CDS:2 [Cetraspora pellucida]|uniref:4314_t:CDS:1 n=1 Tax=Cetraspora pellucida TaxID=1433469 RepID=A0A9N8W6P5_9GLOM|nr:4314_t:CDS:2 [Cetraspora pellucida]
MGSGWYSDSFYFFLEKIIQSSQNLETHIVPQNDLLLDDPEIQSLESNKHSAESILVPTEVSFLRSSTSVNNELLQWFIAYWNIYLHIGLSILTYNYK